MLVERRSLAITIHGRQPEQTSLCLLAMELDFMRRGNGGGKRNVLVEGCLRDQSLNYLKLIVEEMESRRASEHRTRMETQAF